MRILIHIFVAMVMYVCVWTCGDQGIRRGIAMTSTRFKNRRTAGMSSAGFLNKSGAMVMLVSFAF